MKDKIKLVFGNRLVLCSRIVEGKYTFLANIKDLGDARFMGYDYTPEGNALGSRSRKTAIGYYFRTSTSFVNPLVIQYN